MAINNVFIDICLRMCHLERLELNWRRFLIYAEVNMRCGYEVPGIILLQSYLYTYSLLRGVTFKILSLSSYTLSPMMLLLLETFFWMSSAS